MLIIPKVFDYENAASYFRDFWKQNEESLSQRDFADKIGWPSSLLGDIIHERRGLAVSRALEFSKFANMNGVEAERLVYLALKNADNPAVTEYVQTYLQQEGKRWANPAPEAETEEVRYLDAESSVDHLLMSLHIFLIWCQGNTTQEELQKLLYLCPEFKDDQVLAEKMTRLRELGFIAGDFPHVEIKVKNIGTTGMNREQYWKTLDSLRTVPKPHCHWRSSRVVFPISAYSELNQRLNSLMNWIQNLSALKTSDATYTPNDHIILQVNLMLTHLLDLQKLGLSIKPGEDSKHTLTRSPTE